MPPAKTPAPKADSLFLQNLWFFGFYFILLLMIASFGMIAEV